MHQRLQQYRPPHQHSQHNQYGPSQPMHDLRNRLTHLREQREQDNLNGILPSEDSYIHNLPKHPRHSGYGAERNSVPSNRPIGKIEWDEGKTINIKVEVLENGERQYKMDKEDVFKVNITESRSPGSHATTSIIRNENEPGMKARGSGGYRGAARGRSYYRGRGRGSYRGGRKAKTGKGGEKNDNADGASSTTSDVTENELGEQSEGTGRRYEGSEGGEHECEGTYADGEENGNCDKQSTSVPCSEDPAKADNPQSVNDEDVQQLSTDFATKATMLEKVEDKEENEKAIEGETHA